MNKQRIIQTLRLLHKLYYSGDVVINGVEIGIDFWSKQDHVRFWEEDLKYYDSSSPISISGLNIAEKSEDVFFCGCFELELKDGQGDCAIFFSSEELVQRFVEEDEGTFDILWSSLRKRSIYSSKTG